VSRLLPVRPVKRGTIAVIGNFKPWGWGQHPDEAYLADALEVMGEKVVRIYQEKGDAPDRTTEWAIFTGQSALVCGPWQKTHRTIVWTLDWLPSYPERRYIIEAGRKADLFVTSDRFDWKLRYNITNHVYMPGACESVAVELDPRPERPCAFLGSLYNDRRNAIAEIVRSVGGQVLSAPGQWVYGSALAKYCQETKVIVGDNVLNDVPGYWSSRNYVIPGVGGFLLTPEVPGLSDDLVPGRHVAVYGSLEALRTGLITWMSDDAGRERIRKEGFMHVREKHNWGERARTFVSLMKEKAPR
jgi:glycosyltransferase involved in cell wall biosynthesis